MRKKLKSGEFTYYYYYDGDGKLLYIDVFQGKIFKKKYGDYEFSWKNDLLVSQISRIEGIGVTERVLYFYDVKNRLIKKEYYNKESLRYTVTFVYKDEQILPYVMDIKRMSFDFFTTDNPDCIKKMIEIVGKDFEGSFYLLDLVDSYKNNKTNS